MLDPDKRQSKLCHYRLLKLAKVKKQLLQKDSIKNLLIKSSQKWETYVPLEGMGGDVQFVRLEGGEDIKRLKLDYERLVIPPKAIGFPQLEPLFQFEGGKINPTVQTPSPRLLFGLRACDLKGILFVDEFFRKNFEDFYYLNRIKNRLLVVIGCRQPTPNCFCTSTKTGPFLEDGFDLQMIDLKDYYLVEVGSKKGEDFIISHKEFFAEAPEEAVSSAGEGKRRVKEAVTLKIDFEKAIRYLCEDKVPKETYERIAERCIYCGGCLYVCPTCTCFNVFDELKEDEGIRYRNWDTCVFEGYTREAGGSNPRREKWLRTARRYEHKLKYDYLTTGMSGCVGCGRCLDSCPVEIGMSKFIQEITENKKIM